MAIVSMLTPSALLRIAQTLCEDSACSYARNGAVIVSEDGALIGLGSGASVGTDSCQRDGHEMVKRRDLVKGPGVGGQVWQDIETCSRGVDAVIVALGHACQIGASTAGSVLVCSVMPEPETLKLLRPSGISRIMVGSIRPELEGEARRFLKAAAIEFFVVQENEG